MRPTSQAPARHRATRLGRLALAVVTLLGAAGLLSGVAFGSAAGASAPTARAKVTLPAPPGAHGQGEPKDPQQGPGQDRARRPGGERHP